MHALVLQEGTVVACSGKTRPCMNGFLARKRAGSDPQRGEVRFAAERENMGCGASYSFDKNFPMSDHQIPRLHASSGGERKRIYGRRCVH